MKRSTTYLLVGLGLLFVVPIIWFALNFKPGSYANAECYEMNISEQELIVIIQQFKKNNPQYNIPSDIPLSDGRKDSSDYWYHFYFYFSDKNQIIYTWVRSMGKSYTDFALVSVNEGRAIGNWKEVNSKYITSRENSKLKQEFENRILKEIRIKIKSNNYATAYQHL